MPPWGMAGLDSRGLIGRIYVGEHQTLLHTKYISCGPHGFREEDFLNFSHYKSMGAILRHGGHLDLKPRPLLQIFKFPFNTRLHIKSEEIWPRVSEEVFLRCEGMGRLTMDGE